MLTNATITIFNRFSDRNLKKYLFRPCVLPDVWFHAGRKVTAEQGGLTSANEYKIRIPFPRDGWLAPMDFQELANPDGRWTIQKGDLFLVGEWCNGPVDSLAELRKQYAGTIGIVLNYSENFFGSSQHIRIGGGD